MKQILWRDEYSIGVDFIDKEHKQLFATMNKLLQISADEEKSEWVCREGVKYLKNHTVEHFEHEEEYMQSINYGKYELHKRLHDDFRYETLPALENELIETNYSAEAIRHFLGVCIGWVVGHTQTEDAAITGKAKNRWTDIPHGTENDILEQVIIQLTNDMFKHKTKRISEQYSGEEFGKLICCRFIYKGRQDDMREITLIFEERLLLTIIGRLMNAEYQKVDDMIINITRYISRQFLERVSELIPSIDLFKLESESLLTYEQLVKSFKRKHPPCSLLFDTGNGYFAFCMTNSDSTNGKITSTLNHQTAINTINEFLKQEEKSAAKVKTNVPNPKAKQAENRKKKILIVDDSEFMRARIVQLLGKKYDMQEANSSISAIKSMTVDRPDLILLDYEMPVCDGKQALEMIRSDKETAEIPVIFLTGRGDRKSVEEVMELKPERYLLKSMDDDKIVKNIDAFFAKKK